MRRVSSSQQSKNVSLDISTAEQCMQRPSPRVVRTSAPVLNRTTRWLLLAASLVGFSLLICIWTWLPPSTVIGVTFQAQAQDRERRHSPAVREGSTAQQSSRTATTSSGHHSTSLGSSSQPSLATGSSLSRQAQQQLKLQREQRQAAAGLDVTPGVQHHAHSTPTSRPAVSQGGAARQPGGSHSTAGRAGLRAGGVGHSGSTGSDMSANGQAQAASGGSAGGPAAGLHVPASARVVVVGGGLAGLTAALQAAECLAELHSAAGAAEGGTGHANGSTAAVSCLPAQCFSGTAGAGAGAGATPEVDVLVVEKMPRLGGNSAKASSGINALRLEGGDSEELFREDVMSSGGGASRPELVAELVRSSAAAISFLEANGASLPGVTRLGGHSVPRTRTVTGGANVGWVVMSSLMAAVKANPRVKVVEGHTLRRIIMSNAEASGSGSGDARVQGVELVAAGPDGSATDSAAPSVRMSCGSLVLATGGFAANKELLRSVAPEAADLATTNGPWARGEALQVAAAVGAVLEGLPDVQVHPTGFVDPADPAAGTKFLAPEKLRGVGGLLINAEGSRFVDELARRDIVSGAMMALPNRTAWLLLGRDAGVEYGAGTLEFYCKKGLMHKADTPAAAAAVMGISEARLLKELRSYCASAAAAAEGNNGGATSPDPYGKRVFPHPPAPEQQLPLYLACVTPVVHYTMGGVAINERAEVLREGGRGGDVVRGLYAAGEVSGGLHGHNRLGGNSLLECAVFGRIAGSQAAKCGV